jgi:hypothetical protein
MEGGYDGLLRFRPVQTVRGERRGSYDGEESTPPTHGNECSDPVVTLTAWWLRTIRDLRTGMTPSAGHAAFSVAVSSTTPPFEGG